MGAQQDKQVLPWCIIMIPVAAQTGALQNTWEAPSPDLEPCSTRMDAEARAQAWHSSGMLVPPCVPGLPSRAARPTPGYGVLSQHGTVTGWPGGGLAAGVLHSPSWTASEENSSLKMKNELLHRRVAWLCTKQASPKWHTHFPLSSLDFYWFQSVFYKYKNYKKKYKPKDKEQLGSI